MAGTWTRQQSDRPWYLPLERTCLTEAFERHGQTGWGSCCLFRELSREWGQQPTHAPSGPQTAPPVGHRSSPCCPLGGSQGCRRAPKGSPGAQKRPLTAGPAEALVRGWGGAGSTLEKARPSRQCGEGSPLRQPAPAPSPQGPLEGERLSAQGERGAEGAQAAAQGVTEAAGAVPGVASGSRHWGALWYKLAKIARSWRMGQKNRGGTRPREAPQSRAGWEPVSGWRREPARAQCVLPKNASSPPSAAALTTHPLLPLAPDAALQG